jgi:hypothetical protein
MPPLSLEGDSRRPVGSLTLIRLNRIRIFGGPTSETVGAITKQTSKKFSPEVRERAVRMVFDYRTEFVDAAWHT